jgi:hypothetical protein
MANDISIVLTTEFNYPQHSTVAGGWIMSHDANWIIDYVLHEAAEN